MIARLQWMYLVAGLTCGVMAQAPAAKPSVPGAVRTSCSVGKEPASDTEKALAREEYASALDLYGRMATSAPDVSRAGVIRSLLGEDKVAEADRLAEAWVKEQPKSGIAAETSAEVALRKGDIPEAYLSAQKGIALDPCNARFYLVEAEVEALAGNFATSRKHVELAHRLAPTDVDIREAWAARLSRMRRMEELRALLNENLLSAKSAARLSAMLEHSGDHATGECTIDAPVERATFPMQQIVNGSRQPTLALDVFLNGKRRRLEIDTGASGLLLTKGAAASLGLVQEEKRGINGIGDKGEVSSAVAHVASVKIGSLEFHNCAVRILEKSSPLDIDGLIGGNVFSKFLLTLDFPKRQVQLDPLPKRPEEVSQPKEALSTADGGTAAGTVATDEGAGYFDRYIAPEMKDWTRVYRTGHLLLVPMSIGESRTRMFVADTGASTMLISPDAARSVTKVGSDDYARIRGLSGEVNKVYETGRFTLTFGHLRQHVDSMTSIDTTKISHDTGLEVSGFLGAPILQRLTMRIDYRDNLIDFAYDPRN